MNGQVFEIICKKDSKIISEEGEFLSIFKIKHFFIIPKVHIEDDYFLELPLDADTMPEHQVWSKNFINPLKEGAYYKTKLRNPLIIGQKYKLCSFFFKTIYSIDHKVIPLKRLTCLRCGRSWDPRKQTPKNCKFCNSPFWNKPRKNRSHSNENKK